MPCFSICLLRECSSFFRGWTWGVCNPFSSILQLCAAAECLRKKNIGYLHQHDLAKF